MTNDREFDPSLSGEGQADLAPVAERLERGRAVPNPGFRGDLGRRLQSSRGPQRESPAASHYGSLAALCVTTGVLCLAIAALGVAGAGPFAT